MIEVQSSKFKVQNYFLLLILIIGLVVRLYKIDNPVADWHSWRQADTAAVARNFYKEGFNPLIPTYDDMSNISGDGFNPSRFRFVEFPIYSSLVYFGYLINGGVDEKIARFVNILFSLGSLVFIFYIAKKYFGRATGFVASLIYAILPYNIFFSRAILPEPSLVFFCLGMFYFTAKWIDESDQKSFILGIVFGIAAFLTKPTAVFYLIPLGYLVLIRYKTFFKVPKIVYGYLILILFPLLLWRLWIGLHPEGIPASSWLLNGTHIRFKPSFWRWMIGDRLDREILSSVGMVLFIIGLIIRPKDSENSLLHLLLLSLCLYVIVFATGNVQHDYYQYLIIPILAIFVARGFLLLLSGVANFIPKLFTIPLALLFFTLIFYLTWGEVKGLYQINNGSIVLAGKRADAILPKDALVIAPYQGDTAFLYQTNRHGFPFVPLPVEKLVNNFGMTNYVSVNYDAKTKWLMNKYIVIEEKPEYVILDLTKINPKFYASIKTLQDLTEP